MIVMNIVQNDIDCGHDLFSPHRDNYYKLIIPVKGEYKFMLDFNEYDLRAPSLLLVLPGQVHQMTALTSPKGYFIGFDPSLITEDLAQILISEIAHPVLYAEDKEIPTQVLKLIDLLLEISQKRSDTFTSTSAHAILIAILNLTIGYSDSKPADLKVEKNQGARIKREFSNLLRIHYKTWKRPADYAQALAISVAHLNDTLKELTGIPVSEHIQRQSVLEAKRLLFFTDLSVKEIGYNVGYDDPNYFSRLFKKSGNLSPLEFRRQFRDQC